LVSDGARSFTGRLTRSLTFAATAGFDSFFKFCGLDGLDMFHLEIHLNITDKL
jgi:hypothetical protein